MEDLTAENTRLILENRCLQRSQEQTQEKNGLVSLLDQFKAANRRLLSQNEDLKHRCEVNERLRDEMRDQLKRYITQSLEAREEALRLEGAKRDALINGLAGSPQTLNFTDYDLSAYKGRRTAGAILDTTDNDEEEDEVPVFSYKL